MRNSNVCCLDSSEDGLTTLLATIAKAGPESFLASSNGSAEQERIFSFPIAGYALALDFPIAASTLALLDHLDRFTINHGEHFYLAKDSLMSVAALCASDSHVADFQAHHEAQGLTDRFLSAKVKRLPL